GGGRRDKAKAQGSPWQLIRTSRPGRSSTSCTSAARWRADMAPPKPKPRQVPAVPAPRKLTTPAFPAPYPDFFAKDPKLDKALLDAIDKGPGRGWVSAVAIVALKSDGKRPMAAF